MPIPKNTSKETERGSKANKPGILPFTKAVRLNFSSKIFNHPKPRKMKKFWSNVTATSMEKGVMWQKPRKRTLPLDYLTTIILELEFLQPKEISQRRCSTQTAILKRKHQQVLQKTCSSSIHHQLSLAIHNLSVLTSYSTERLITLTRDISSKDQSNCV